MMYNSETGISDYPSITEDFYDDLPEDDGELGFWTYGGGRLLDFPKDPDTMVIIPIDEIIDSRFLCDTPPIDAK